MRRTIGLAGESTGSRTAKDIKYLGYDRKGGEADVKRGRIKAEQGKRQSRSGEWQSRPGIHPYEGAPSLRGGSVSAAILQAGRLCRFRDERGEGYSRRTAIESTRHRHDPRTIRSPVRAVLFDNCRAPLARAFDPRQRAAFCATSCKQSCAELCKKLLHGMIV